MNTDQIIQAVHIVDYKQIILILFFLGSIVIAGFNIVYLNQSLHVTSHHMGIRAPIYLRQILKIGIFVSFLSAGFSLFITLAGFY